MVLPVWYTEASEPFIISLVEELNVSDEASSAASHPVSLFFTGGCDLTCHRNCLPPQLLAKVQLVCKRLCTVLNTPVPKVVAELFSLASSMEVMLPLLLSLSLSRHSTGGGE